MYDRQRAISTPCCGTETWLLQTREYAAWLEGHHRFFWLKGKAGSGKSTFMEQTLKYLQSHFLRDSFAVAAYFFEGSGAPLEKTTSGLLRSILYPLFTGNQPLLEEFLTTSEDGIFVRGMVLFGKLRNSWKF